MENYRSGSLWSNTFVFGLLILIMFALASGTSAVKGKANPSQPSRAQVKPTAPSIPVTGGTGQANLSPPASSGSAPIQAIPLSGPYIVQAGDTLESVAWRFNTTVDALLRANPQTSITTPLTAGEILYIPGSTVVIDGQATYIVKSGDDLFAIAAANNVSLAALEQANSQITDPRLIFPGQWVAIP